MDPAIVRSREGVRVVATSLGVLALTAAAQAVVFVATASVALLADLIHNVGDALTALPLAVAFLMRSPLAERRAGYVVVGVIFASACLATYEAIDRLIHPQSLAFLWAVAAAGLIGFAGNEVAARIRLSGGRRLDSAALTADGHHARVDGLVSLSVVAGAALAAAGFERGDPLIGLVIAVVILRITWQAFLTVRRSSHGA